MYYCGRNELLGIEQLIWDMHGLPVCSEIKFLSRISCCLRPSTSPRSSSSRRFILVILTSFPVFNFVARSIFLSTYINSLLSCKPTNQNTRNIRQCKEHFVLLVCRVTTELARQTAKTSHGKFSYLSRRSDYSS